MDTTGYTEIIKILLEAGGLMGGLGVAFFIGRWVYLKIIVANQLRSDKMVSEKEALMTTFIDQNQKFFSEFIDKIAPKMDEFTASIHKLTSGLDRANLNAEHANKTISLIQTEVLSVVTALNNKADKQDLSDHVQQFTTLKAKFDLEQELKKRKK